MAKIYIADDDKDTLRLLNIFLTNENHNVSMFNTGDDLYKAFFK